MTEITKILFPIDFSDQSANAAAYVKERARRFGAAVTVLHVADPTTFFYHGGDLALRPMHQIQDELISIEKKKFHALVARLFDETNVSQLMRVGRPADTIASFAEEQNLDVIMLPLNTQKLLSATFEDSLPAKVMELSGRPLWTVEHADALSPQAPYSRTVCALDFHPDGSLDGQNRRILETAKLVSRTLQTKLTFLHVIAAADMEQGGLSGIRLHSWLEQQLIQIRSLAGPESSYLVETGDVPQTVAETARKLRAGLVITGRSHQTSITGRAQSRVLRLVQRSPCPVLSVC